LFYGVFSLDFPVLIIRRCAAAVLLSLRRSLFPVLLFRQSDAQTPRLFYCSSKFFYFDSIFAPLSDRTVVLISDAYSPPPLERHTGGGGGVCCLLRLNFDEADHANMPLFFSLRQRAVHANIPCETKTIFF